MALRTCNLYPNKDRSIIMLTSPIRLCYFLHFKAPNGFSLLADSFPGSIQTNDGGCFRPGHGASIQSSSPSGRHRGDWRVQFSAAIAKPASPASPVECWKPSRPASSTGCWRSASSTPSACQRRATTPATSARQHRATYATAEPISAHVWGVGVWIVWGSTCFRLQDCPN
jgi:hypothetical protein